MRKLAVLGGLPAFATNLYLTRPVVPNRTKLYAVIDDILDRRWLTNNGRYVVKFEEKLRAYLKAPYCSVYCNGTVALQLAIYAQRLTGEVITTPFSFPATAHVLHWNGIVPVFCDIDPETYNIDIEKLESLISSKTTGILPVHVFGNPCEVKGIDKLAHIRGLKVIYDAAHAMGVEVAGLPIGTFGDASMFSFHATKLFNTIEGGALTCKEPGLDRLLRDLRNFGIRGEEEIVLPGINAKMNEIQAGFGLLNIGHIDDTIKKRKAKFEEYKKKLRGLPGIEFQKLHKDAKYNYAYMVVEIDPKEFGLTRDLVYACFREERILVRKYFHPLISNYHCYRALPSSNKELLPNANRVASRTLCLPFHEDIETETVDTVCQIFRSIHKHQREIKSKLWQA